MGRRERLRREGKCGSKRPLVRQVLGTLVSPHWGPLAGLRGPRGEQAPPLGHVGAGEAGPCGRKSGGGLGTKPFLLRPEVAILSSSGDVTPVRFPSALRNHPSEHYFKLQYFLTITMTFL